MQSFQSPTITIRRGKMVKEVKAKKALFGQNFKKRIQLFQFLSAQHCENLREHRSYKLSPGCTYTICTITQHKNQNVFLSPSLPCPTASKAIAQNREFSPSQKTQQIITATVQSVSKNGIIFASHTPSQLHSTSASEHKYPVDNR